MDTCHPKVWVHEDEKHLLVDEDIVPFAYALLEAGLKLVDIHQTDVQGGEDVNRGNPPGFVSLMFEEFKEAKEFLNILAWWPGSSNEFLKRVVRWKFHGSVYGLRDCMNEYCYIFSQWVCFPKEDLEFVLRFVTEHNERNLECRYES